MNQELCKCKKKVGAGTVGGLSWGGGGGGGSGSGRGGRGGFEPRIESIVIMQK